jgi:predicted nuclease of predicted toxin-antitoxin system
MPGTIRFHLDENVSSAIADGLRNRSVDFTTTIEEGLIASSDQAQLEFALSQKRVVFTQDADFLRLHQAGADHAGIAYCQQGSRSIGEILRGLILIWELLEPEDIHGQVEFI